MILWTIQDVGTWKRWQRDERIRGGRRILDATFEPAYTWMAQQMEKRGFGRADGRRLVWGWNQWQGIRRCRPDLRAGGHMPRGQRGVRVELQVPDEEVLLSDTEMYLEVINRLADLAPGVPVPDLPRWQEMFDLDWTGQDEAAPRGKKYIQGTFWEAPVSAVTDVTEFVAR